MIVICAWCGKFKALKRPFWPPRMLLARSHGICFPCFVRLQFSDIIKQLAHVEELILMAPAERFASLPPGIRAEDLPPGDPRRPHA